MEKGYFREEGTEISKIVGGSGGGGTLRNLLSTDAPLAEVATSAAVAARNEGVPLVAVAGAGRNLGGNLLVASKKSGIRGLDDVRGRAGLRLGFSAPGSTTETLVKQALTAWNLPPDRTVLRSTGGVGEGVALLAAGDIDVVVVPSASYVGHESDMGPVLADGAELAPEYMWGVLASTDKLVAERRPQILALLRGLQRSVEFVYQDPRAAAEIWNVEADLDPQTAASAVQQLVDKRSIGAGEITAAGLSTADKVVREQGAGDVRVADIFDTSFMTELGLDVPAELR
jgi:NitT/TauT family transport system substrate-binding protein